MSQTEKLCALVRAHLAWEEIISTGRDDRGERVEINGAAVLSLRPIRLAEIGRAALEARVDLLLEASA